ncbi:hypothetical protein Tsubulata_051045 [Turnera subulata]|uniref:Uncharacterized protein n=1 Tax=Turnera subulata TaxID=218843 RepID=A0A9Q0JKE0_9ROSI|nr:hypothetical protein Tsubulata_051045 [Turnera subulata]
MGYRKMSCFVVTLTDLESLYRALEMMILDLQQQTRSLYHRALEKLRASINYDFLSMENHCYQVLRWTLIQGIGFTLILLTVFCLGIFGHWIYFDFVDTILLGNFWREAVGMVGAVEVLVIYSE